MFLGVGNVLREPRAVVADPVGAVLTAEAARAGQAVVQFVLAPQSNCQYAIKFFANRSAYNDEKQLYLTSELAQFMPTVLEFHDNLAGTSTDPLGNPLPPCFVMEKGESLSDRTKRCEHDLFTTIQVRHPSRPRWRARPSSHHALCYIHWQLCREHHPPPRFSLACRVRLPNTAALSALRSAVCARAHTTIRSTQRGRMVPARRVVCALAARTHSGPLFVPWRTSGPQECRHPRDRRQPRAPAHRDAVHTRGRRCPHTRPPLSTRRRVQIIGQVAKCLADLHAHGWVHRDLKPANIMFLTRSDTWTLIDFGLAWRVGQPASIGYTLAYAAPEVITAKIAGVKRLVAEASVDAWALGVMAFELLTGSPAFNMFHMSLVEVPHPAPAVLCLAAHACLWPHGRCLAGLTRSLPPRAAGQPRQRGVSTVTMRRSCLGVGESLHGRGLSACLPGAGMGAAAGRQGSSVGGGAPDAPGAAPAGQAQGARAVDAQSGPCASHDVPRVLAGAARGLLGAVHQRMRPP